MKTPAIATAALLASAGLTPANLGNGETLPLPAVSISTISTGRHISWNGIPGQTYFPTWSLDLAEWHAYPSLFHGAAAHTLTDSSNPAKLFVRLHLTDAPCADPDLADFDADGWSNATELAAGTDPLDPDTDRDGAPDGTDPSPLSAANGGDFTYSADSDADGDVDLSEILRGTSATLADTDGDGFADAADAFPLDPARHLPGEADSADTTAPLITLIHPGNAIPVSSN